MKQKTQFKLTEGLQQGDLKRYVSDIFSIDRYSSKMGEDKDIVVLGFRVKEKLAAEDLMEFIEKGYSFILDADMSTGEENDGQYQVFAEIQRNTDIAENISSLLNGVGQLCDCTAWKFRYQKSSSSVEFNKENILEHVPTSAEEYENTVLEYKNNDLTDFFDQGSVEVTLESNNDIKFKKPYSGEISAKFIAIGDYESIKHKLPGKLSLDESSQSQCLFLTKYLGTYDIDKIGNKFLIRNQDKAIIIEKERW